MVQEGAQAPDFSLPDEAGRTHTLREYRGRWVVLFFYPKDMTPGCTKEACDFRDARAAEMPKDVVVLGVSADDMRRHAKFAEKERLNFPLLADPEKTVLAAYGVWKEKSMYGRTYFGIVRTTVLIDAEGRVAKTWEKVKVPGHVEDVLRTLETVRR